MDSDAAEHASFIDDSVRRAVAGGISDFGPLLRGLPGVFPTDVAASIVRCGLSHIVPTTTTGSAGTSQTPATPGPGVPRQQLATVPPPHPLDFDWRFDEGSVSYLLEVTGRAMGGHPLRLLLGSPSLIRVARTSGSPGGFVLIDKNASDVAHDALDRYREIRRDIVRDELPPLAADVAVADPPWYPSHTHAFLWAARRLVKPGGNVYLSFPPRGTRPGIAREWAETHEFARADGLDLVEFREGALRYDTPFFEMNALRALGLGHVPRDWRRGDLAVFRVIPGDGVQRPEIAEALTPWTSHFVQGLEVRVRSGARASVCDPRLTSVVDGDVLPSVSTRDPRRDGVDVWTSGNRVFRCKDVVALSVVVRHDGNDVPLVEAVQDVVGRTLDAKERDAVTQAQDQVRSVMTLEREEYALHQGMDAR